MLCFGSDLSCICTQRHIVHKRLSYESRFFHLLNIFYSFRTFYIHATCYNIYKTDPQQHSRAASPWQDSVLFFLSTKQLGSSINQLLYMCCVLCVIRGRHQRSAAGDLMHARLNAPLPPAVSLLH